MNFIKTVLAVIAAMYFSLYWLLIIFVPYLEARDGTQIIHNFSNLGTFLFFHPAVFIGMVVVLALSMLSLGKACALDEVSAARERAVLQIYKHKESLAKYVNLGRQLAKADTATIVDKYVDDILASEEALKREK